MTELICELCTHARRMHSKHGCFYQLELGECPCDVTFMDRIVFIPGTPLTNWSNVSISDVINSLGNANLTAGEALGVVIETKGRLANAVASLAESIGSVGTVLGEAQVDTVLQALGHFQSAQNQINEALRTLDDVETSIHAAMNNNQEYIGRLS